MPRFRAWFCRLLGLLRKTALRQFGGLEQTKEVAREQRVWRWADDCCKIYASARECFGAARDFLFSHFFA
jgi:hypothetical protein